MHVASRRRVGVAVGARAWRRAASCAPWRAGEVLEELADVGRRQRGVRVRVRLPVRSAARSRGRRDGRPWRRSCSGVPSSPIAAAWMAASAACGSSGRSPVAAPWAPRGGVRGRVGRRRGRVGQFGGYADGRRQVVDGERRGRGRRRPPGALGARVPGPASVGASARRKPPAGATPSRRSLAGSRSSPATVIVAVSAGVSECSTHVREPAPLSIGSVGWSVSTATSPNAITRTVPPLQESAT